MPASNPTYGKCSDGNLQKTRDNRGRFHLFCLAAVGGGRSHCIAVERFCWFAVNLAFALQGLAHFYYFKPVALGATNRTVETKC